jgi:3',5'-cyclic AMP phosphodiesterase CpdA
MSITRIAHISDLHLSAKHARMNIRNAKRLLEQIKRLDVDHVVVTGDISANADEDDFLVARSLFHAAGLFDSNKMSIVIGNHDVYGGVHMAEDILEFPRRCRKVNLAKKMDRFNESFRPLFRNAYYPDEKSPFPYIKPLDDVLLIGLSSVAEYSSVKNPVGSNGLVDERQQKHMDQMLSSGQFKRSKTIILIHHHFNKIERPANGTMQSVWQAFEQHTMKLRGKKDLMDLFRKHRVDAILHGHYHENMEYTRKGLHFINGGGSILGPRPSVLHLNVLHVSANEVRLEHLEFPIIDGTPSVRALQEDQELLPTHAAA